MITTVDVRSYSRNSGIIWCEMDSGSARSFSAAATAFSFFVFAKENSREMAIACGFASAILASSESSSSQLGVVRISPSAARW